MYSRLFQPPRESFFLFGPRATGKSSLVTKLFPDALTLDLLDAALYTRLLAHPERLDELIPEAYGDWIIIDEVQKVPTLLDEVHRQISKKGRRFVLTGSNARKLKRQGVNLLAGRALTERLYPLTAEEIGTDFDLGRALRYGHLPKAVTTSTPEKYLASYVQTYLKEEIQQEGLTRNIDAFARFLESASFSQGSVLNMASVARDSSVHAKVVEEYFAILRDLLISYELPAFHKRARRKLVARPKFYFFDAGVFRAIRPTGPLDSDSELGGAALETLVLQEMIAQNAYRGWGYTFHYWRTQQKQEVDFVLYGKNRMLAIEVKASSRLREEDLSAIKLFRADYPEADALVVYGGTKEQRLRDVTAVPAKDFLVRLAHWIAP